MAIGKGVPGQPPQSPSGLVDVEPPLVEERAAAEELAHPALQPASEATRVGAARGRTGALFVLPGILLLVLLVAFPLVMEVYISFTSWTPLSPQPWYRAYEFWAGISNFAEGVSNTSFLASGLRTILITAVAVGVEALLGFGLALLFARQFPLKRVATVLMLLPMMVVPAVAGFVFFLLLQINGPVNSILSKVWPGDVSIAWLSHPNWAPVSVILADVWQWTPLMFLIFLSGLLALPDDQLNAAEILGASWFQRMRWVVFPMMKPIILIALIIRSMEAFKIFDSAWLLTQGGPGEASSTISVKLYREAFLNSQWSFTAALAILVMIFVSFVAFYAVRPLEKAQEGNL
jgi:multiple sugar transport system permease protein